MVRALRCFVIDVDSPTISSSYSCFIVVHSLSSFHVCRSVFSFGTGVPLVWVNVNSTRDILEVLHEKGPNTAYLSTS